MIRTVLIVGIDREANQFTRFVTSYGLRALHHPPELPKSLPDADLAICVLSCNKHALTEAIKAKFYKENKKVLFCHSGTSEIKREFEEICFGKNLNLLKNEEIAFLPKLAWILGRLYKPEETISKMKIRELAKKFIDQKLDEKEYHVNNSTSYLRAKNCLIDLSKKAGKYQYNGLTHSLLMRIEQAGFDISPEMKFLVTSKKEEQAAPIEEKTEVSTPQVVSEEVVQEVVPLTTKSSLTLEEVGSLLLESIDNMNNRLMLLEEHLNQRFKKVEDRIENTLGKHHTLFKLFPIIRKLPKGQLDSLTAFVTSLLPEQPQENKIEA